MPLEPSQQELQSRGLSADNPRRDAVFVTLFAAAVVLCVWRSFRYGHDSWQMTEWLLNYSGGFVRRGLGGAAIGLLNRTTGIPSSWIAIAVSVVAYAAVLAWFLRAARGRIPMYIVLSALLMGAPVFGDYLVRKDVLEIGLMLVCLSVLSGRWSAFAKLAAVNLVCCVAVLNHESFMFFALPAIACVLRARLWPQARAAAGWLHTAAALLPAWLACAAVTLHKGTGQTADTINRSLLPAWQRVGNGDCCLDQPTAAIAALRMNMHDATFVSEEVFKSYSVHIYVPVLWVLTIAGFWLLLQNAAARTAARFDPDPAPRTGAFANTLFWQLLCVVPLFAVGWDFGRWIFFWTASATALYLSGASAEIPRLLWPLRRPSAARGFTARLTRLRVSGWVLLFIGAPGCCWNPRGYGHSTPVGYLAGAAIKHTFGQHSMDRIAGNFGPPACGERDACTPLPRLSR